MHRRTRTSDKTIETTDSDRWWYRTLGLDSAGVSATFIPTNGPLAAVLGERSFTGRVGDVRLFKPVNYIPSIRTDRMQPLPPRGSVRC